MDTVRPRPPAPRRLRRPGRASRRLRARDGSQFIIASHSPILLGTPGAQIFSFDDGRIREVAYEETESYQVTELFINNREGLLRQLL